MALRPHADFRVGRDSETRALPFVKWVGGKRQLLDHIVGMLPANYNNYFEPFAGGGAVFFRLASLGLIRQATLGDANPHLVCAYGIVRDRPVQLCQLLDSLREAHSTEQYYGARERFNADGLSELERAAFLIYLNKTCYNGLYRVNSRGLFNVPVGRYVNPKVFCVEQIDACSRALQGATIRCADFQEVLAAARAGDFVYLDPPYVPLTKTANFTSYSRGKFTFDDQKRLSDTFRDLSGRGVKVLLSNHATPELLELYDGFDVKVVPARRVLNTNAARRRNKVDEVLIRNY